MKGQEQHNRLRQAGPKCKCKCKCMCMEARRPGVHVA